MNTTKAPKLGPLGEAGQAVNKEDTLSGLVSQISIPPSLPLTTDDPNFDPNWDWTLDEPQNLFAQTQNGITMFGNVRLPYYADTGPAADDFNNDAPGVRDILPVDGWMLLFRDFGTPDRGTNFPRFILYNRFRGLLRLFYFNPHFPEAFTYGIVTLQKQSASGPFGLLNFTDLNRSTLSDYDPERKEVFIGRLEPVAWNYADFLVVGFEPNLPEDARFQFEITGVQQSDISLEGNLTLDGILKQKNFVTSKSGLLGDLITIGEGTVSLFKNLETLKKVVADEIEDSASLTDVKGIFSAGIALVKLFSSGSKPEQAQMLLNLKGEIKLAGTINLKGAIGSFLLRVPGARHLGNTDLPLYDKPLGIFNLRSRPLFDLKVILVTTLCRNTDDFGPKTLRIPLPRHHEHNLRPPEVIINPEGGFTAFVEEALVRSNGTLETGYVTLGHSPIIRDSFDLRRDCNSPEPPIQRRSVAIRLTITPKEAVPDFTPVSIVKLYGANYSISEIEA